MTDTESKENTNIPKKWAIAPFDLVFDNVTSSKLKLKQRDYLETGKYPVVDQGETLVGGYSNEQSLVHPGPLPVIIFGDHTRCFKYFDRPFIQGADGTKVLAPSTVMNPKYAFWVVRTRELPNKGYARHYSHLRKTVIPIAPFKEQGRIIESIESNLTKLDAAVAALKRVKANLKRYRASVLKSAVEGRLVPTEAELARKEGRDYEPASKLLERILKERRRRWEEAELAKIESELAI